MGIHYRHVELAGDWLTEDGKGAGLLAHSLHARLVVTPDVAVVEPFRPEIARVQWFTSADVIPECFDQILQRAAMGEAAPLATPNCFMGEDPLPGVVVDQPSEGSATVERLTKIRRVVWSAWSAGSML